MAARIKVQKGLADPLLIFPEARMDLDYDYVSQKKPSAGKEIDAFLGDFSLKGMAEVRHLPVIDRIFLQNMLIAGDGLYDWDLYLAVFLNDLAALIKNAERDCLSHGRISLFILGNDRQSISSGYSSAQSSPLLGLD
jgi:hypothetical protein